MNKYTDIIARLEAADHIEALERRLAEADVVIERLADAAESVSWSSNTSLMNNDIERARSYLEGRK